jgi:hypothetical protein
MENSAGHPACEPQTRDHLKHWADKFRAALVALAEKAGR